MLRLLFHMDMVEWVRCQVPESQSVDGGVKSACEGLMAGGRRRLILGGIAVCADRELSLLVSKSTCKSVHGSDPV